jgi:hypothetical protein
MLDAALLVKVIYSAIITPLAGARKGKAMNDM